jgi:hypothetical protein
LVVLAIITVAVWTIIIGSIVVEQTGKNSRAVYTLDMVYAMVQPMRYSILEPVDPEIERAI